MNSNRSSQQKRTKGGYKPSNEQRDSNLRKQLSQQNLCLPVDNDRSRSFKRPSQLEVPAHVEPAQMKRQIGQNMQGNQRQYQGMNATPYFEMKQGADFSSRVSQGSRRSATNFQPAQFMSNEQMIDQINMNEMVASQANRYTPMHPYQVEQIRDQQSQHQYMRTASVNASMRR